MKKLTYVGLALLLSFALGGLSAAQDGLTTAGHGKSGTFVQNVHNFILSAITGTSIN